MPYLDLDSDAVAIRTRLAAGAPLVACLCAAWCGACREYRDVFAALAEAYPALCFVWIDIENQAETVDVFDVEDFPTMLLEDGDGTRFFGPLLPQRGVLDRLLSEMAHLPHLDGVTALRPLLSG